MKTTIAKKGVEPKFRNPLLLLLGCWLSVCASSGWAEIWTEVEHGYAQIGDVKIHYATLGEGPLVVMIHGFPDFWYSWREQMAGLADEFQVVAIDQRGYNLSSQPQGDENYAMPLLVSDHIMDVPNVVVQRGHHVGDRLTITVQRCGQPLQVIRGGRHQSSVVVFLAKPVGQFDVMRFVY